MDKKREAETDPTTGLGFRVQGLGFRVPGSKFRTE